jgi:cytochrome oxidase Cu insertion factor (SCO1/SenC/PrrC family)
LEETMTTQTSEPSTYRFARFDSKQRRDDLALFYGPVPGEPLPDFELESVQGERIQKEDFLGRKPLLLTFGSLTCPMTASAAPVLRRLHALHGADVEFMTVYVREAHPGEQIGQPETFAEKAAHARALKQRDLLAWTVAVDGVEGEFHKALGSHPNSAFLVDSDGRIAFRSLWSNDERGLAEALEAAAAGRPTPVAERQARVVPALSGLGSMAETLEAAGPQAKRDVLTQRPHVFLMAQLAGLFRPLSPLGRGVAAVTVAALGTAAIAASLKRSRPRR